MARNKSINTLIFTAIFLFLCGEAYAGKFVTNKWEKKAAVRNGGWYVAYGRELTETDVIHGLVAAGISIYTSNSVVVSTWAQNLIKESIVEMQTSLGQVSNQFGLEAQRRSRNLAIHVIRDLLRGKRPGVSGILRHGVVEFKAGVSEYNGRNQVWDPTYGCSFGNFTHCGGYRTISTTWALVPYVAIRFRPGVSPRPPTHIAQNRYALACVVNDTHIPIMYHAKWGSGQWQLYKVEPGYQRGHYWRYENINQNRSPELHVKFDYDLRRNGSQVKVYQISQWAVPNTKCNRLNKKEHFKYADHGTKIDLYRDY